MPTAPQTTVDPDATYDTVTVTFEFEPPLTAEKLIDRFGPIVETAEDADQ